MKQWVSKLLDEGLAAPHEFLSRVETDLRKTFMPLNIGSPMLVSMTGATLQQGSQKRDRRIGHVA
jgi:hypothetical protein